MLANQRVQRQMAVHCTLSYFKCKEECLKTKVCYIVTNCLYTVLTAKGSACSQEMGAPQDAGRIRSGRDSGTAIKINNRSDAATNVASATTALWSYMLLR